MARAAATKQGTRERHRLLRETLTVMRLLARARWTADELAAEARLHRRALYRVLAAMERAGLAVERQREGPHHVYLRLSRETLERWLWS